MKKLLCAVLAGALVFGLAACSGDDTPETTTQPEPTTVVLPQDKTFAWPDNALFGDVPAIKERVEYYRENKNDKGYTYEFAANGISYDEFRAYIAALEEAGFSIYKDSLLDTIKTADVLPEKLAEGKNNVVWSGNRRGLYVAAFWYGDEYYEANGLEQSYNVRLTFYTYNAFETVD